MLHKLRLFILTITDPLQDQLQQKLTNDSNDYDMIFEKYYNAEGCVYNDK